MDDYAITFARSARKELEKLPASVVQKLHPQGCRKAYDILVFMIISLLAACQSKNQPILTTKSTIIHSATSEIIPTPLLVATDILPTTLPTKTPSTPTPTPSSKVTPIVKTTKPRI